MSDTIVFAMNSNSKTITLPDGTVDAILAAFADSYKWEAEVVDPEDSESTIPNPLSQNDLVTKMVRKFIVDTTRASQKRTAAAAAKVAVDTQLDAIEDAGIVTDTL